MDGYYIFYRLWIGWNPLSSFPFDKFNSLPDDEVATALQVYAEEWCEKHREKLNALAKSGAARPTKKLGVLDMKGKDDTEPEKMTAMVRLSISFEH